MSRSTLLIERGDGYGEVFSVQGSEELFVNTIEAIPEIKGIIVEVNGDIDLSSAYQVTESDEPVLTSGD